MLDYSRCERWQLSSSSVCVDVDDDQWDEDKFQIASFTKEVAGTYGYDGS